MSRTQVPRAPVVGSSPEELSSSTHHMLRGKLKSGACPKEDVQVGTRSHGNNGKNGSVNMER